MLQSPFSWRITMPADLATLGLDKLSVEERLELIETLWDSLPDQFEASMIPDWHLAEIAKRRTEAAANRRRQALAPSARSTRGQIMGVPVMMRAGRRSRRDSLRDKYIVDPCKKGRLGRYSLVTGKFDSTFFAGRRTMNATNDKSGLADELAARWTDSALEILAAAGIHGSSVDMEIESWHTLTEVLQSAAHRQEGLWFRPLNVQKFMQHILFSALQRVARKFAPKIDAFDLMNRIRPSIRRQKVKAREYEIYSQIFRGPAAEEAAQSWRRSDSFARMQAISG
jgi:putative addiction module component (TIGR02574 family)